MKSLFICTTPLHSLIVERIIQLHGLAPADCTLLFFTLPGQPKRAFYFERLAPLFAETHLYETGSQRWPGNLLGARALLRGRAFDTVFLANTNHLYLQMVLSSLQFGELRTYDDGTTNLGRHTAYTDRHGVSRFRLLTSLVLGNRYPQPRLRARASRHYTIFPGLWNNTLAPLTPLPLLEERPAQPVAGKCSVILGTVLAEAFEIVPPDIDERLAALANQAEGDVFYLPHPKGEPSERLAGITLHSNLIAEHLILDLLDHYAEMDLYGFASCTQFVFLAEPRIRNHFLTAGKMSPALREIQQNAASAYPIDQITL